MASCMYNHWSYIRLVITIVGLFVLSSVPDCFKRELQQERGWIKLCLKCSKFASGVNMLTIPSFHPRYSGLTEVPVVLK